MPAGRRRTRREEGENNTIEREVSRLGEQHNAKRGARWPWGRKERRSAKRQGVAVEEVRCGEERGARRRGGGGERGRGGGSRQGGGGLACVGGEEVGEGKGGVKRVGRRNRAEGNARGGEEWGEAVEDND